MRATMVLLRQCLRLTLFTRPQCSLCEDAKGVLSTVWDRRPFEYDEVNVMAAKQDKWRALYEFDTPVVRSFSLALNPLGCTDRLQVHINATEENNHSFETTTAAQKLMHRFSEQDLESGMDKAIMSTK